MPLLTSIRFFLSISVLTICFALPIRAAETVKVYLLAGQSNMVGKAQNKLLDFQAKQESTKDEYTKYRKNGQWVVRDDVWIRFGARHGGLTIGYGSKNRTGLELAFGTRMGDHHDEPVLLIKTAWGGHSLAQKFRSPSAGLPDEKSLQDELAKAIARVKRQNEKHQRSTPLPTMTDIKGTYGSSYRKMQSEVQDTMQNYATLFPLLKGKKLEIVGFVWFQGWNDQYNGAEQEYASNMQHFINDIRKDLNIPKLPFVIGVMGQNGAEPAKGAMKVIQDAQLLMEQKASFKDNVKAVKTDILEDKRAAQIYPEWKQQKDLWEQVGSDQRYHYLGSAIWFNRIGNACADAMLKLQR